MVYCKQIKKIVLHGEILLKIWIKIIYTVILKPCEKCFLKLKKVLKRKGTKLFMEWKRYDFFLIFGLIKDFFVKSWKFRNMLTVFLVHI